MKIRFKNIMFASINLLSTYVYASTFDKVVWVIFENTNYKDAIKDPNFKTFADRGILFENMYAETHPSQGNYIAMISGNTHGVKNDNPITLEQSHIGDLLENKKMQWKVYAEDYPGNCFLKKSFGNYARKHVPFLSFKNVTANPIRCANIQNSSFFLEDLKNNMLPEFSMFIPNNLNNGHDTGVKNAGKWLFNNFDELISDQFIEQNVLFIISFDEDNFTSKNHIYTVMIHPKIAKKSTNIQKLNHYSILKLIESEYELGSLNQNDETADEITKIWL